MLLCASYHTPPRDGQFPAAVHRIQHRTETVMSFTVHPIVLDNPYPPLDLICMNSDVGLHGGRVLLTELSLCYSLILCSVSAMHIMSSSFRLVYWIGL